MAYNTSFYTMIHNHRVIDDRIVSLYATYSSVKIEDLLGHGGILPPTGTEGQLLTVYGGVPAWRNLESQQTVTILASEDLGGHKAITASGYLADVGTIAHAPQIIGISMSAVMNGEPLDVVVYGLVSEPSWSFTPGQPVYVGVSGALTQIAPISPASKYRSLIGIATASDKLLVNVSESIILG